MFPKGKSPPKIFSAKWHASTKSKGCVVRTVDTRVGSRYRVPKVEDLLVVRLLIIFSTMFSGESRSILVENMRFQYYSESHLIF